MCVRETPLAEVFYFLPDNDARKRAANAFDGTRSFLMRGNWPARWELQEESMMSIAASFPSVKKPRFNIGQERRDKRLKVMLASLRQLQTIYIWCLVQALLASCNAEPAHNTTKYFAPNLRWGCQSHRFAWNKVYERIEWKTIKYASKVNSASKVNRW
jgi:hypothetical protein